MQIPEKLGNFKIYGGQAQVEQIGIATVTLPAFEALTETISGAGLAGEWESPTLGQFKSMMLGLKFRVFTKQSGGLLAPGIVVLSAYNSVQSQDPVLGTLYTSPWRVDVRGLVKKLDMGKLEPGKVTDQEVEVEIIAIVVSYEGAEIVMLDKPSNVFRVNGKDYLSSVRSDLGGA